MSDETKIYVIEHPEGYVKIGKSVHPSDRLSQIQAACPYELELRTVLYPRGRGDVEQLLHRLFEPKNVRREWFDLSPEELDWLDAMGRLDDSTVEHLLESDSFGLTDVPEYQFKKTNPRP